MVIPLDGFNLYLFTQLTFIFLSQGLNPAYDAYSKKKTKGLISHLRAPPSLLCAV